MTAFIEFREEVITKKTIFDLNKARDKAHVLLGLVVAKANIDEIIDLIKSNNDKAFNQIRQLVADSNIRDYNELYRALFENLDSFHNPVLGTVIIAEAQYQSVMAPDKEVNFMGCIANLLKPF